MSLSGIAKRCLEPVLNMKMIKVSDKLTISKKKTLLLTKYSKVVLVRINRSYVLGFSIPGKCFPFLPISSACYDSEDCTESEFPEVAGSMRAPVLPLIGSLLRYAKTQSGKGGPVRQSGGRIGRLDAANEAGMFHKLSRARLEELKKKLTEIKDAIKSEEGSNPEKKL